jgi:hypothetical protein
VGLVSCVSITFVQGSQHERQYTEFTVTTPRMESRRVKIFC